MKKTVLAVIFVLLVYWQVFAQSAPIMGYDRVAWGASVSDVRREYNLGNNVVLQENYGDDPNIAALIQENVSDSIYGRIFLFNKWKGSYQLYRVWVIYDADRIDIGLLITGLENRFGQITGVTRGPGAGTGTASFEYGKYSPELVVEAHASYGGAFELCYTWKRFRDEYQTRNVQF